MGMTLMIRLLLFLSFALALTVTHAQHITLRGQVLDASNNRPVSSVHVYFNNTTIGAATDQEGKFLISKVPVGLSSLIISSVGYKTLVINNLDFSAGEDTSLDIKIVPATRILAPITIRSGRAGSLWSKRYYQFRDILLGKTSNASRTEIQNPEVLSFEALESDIAGFTAHALGPIELVNKGLGYRLYVTLDEFQTNRSSYKIQFSTRFDTLAPNGPQEALRWKRGRLDAYKGSQRHLFQSLITGRHASEGFLIYGGDSSTHVPRYREDGTVAMPRLYKEAKLADLVVDTSQAHPRILRQGMYQVNYQRKVLPQNKRYIPGDPSPVSWIIVEDPYLELQTYGDVKTPAKFWRSGYMDKLRLADLLPSNYDPVKEEGQLSLIRQFEQGTISGRVVDEHGKPIAGALIFINRGLTQSTTDAWGQFRLNNLDPGNYPLAFTGHGKKDTLLILQTGDDDVTVQMKSSPYFEPGYDPYRLSHEEQFHRTFFNDTRIKYNYSIRNIGVLQFVQDKNSVHIRATAPLIVENTQLGYQWKYFIREGTLKGSELRLSYLLKMDTLEAGRLGEIQKQEKNRLKAYPGTWNHFMKSLQVGNAEEQRYRVYRVNPKPNKKRRFSKLKAEQVQQLSEDSVLVVRDGKMYLNVRPGLEVHNQNRPAGGKLYRGQRSEVLRLHADSALNAITHTGIYDPTRLIITGTQLQLLPSIPVDFVAPEDRLSNPDVQFYINSEIVKAIKDVQEKVYVHTDRTHYYPGDTIWMKAWFRYANPAIADSLSKVLYINLLNADGKKLSTSVLKINGGQADGALFLDERAPAGNYYLVASTHWMRNFNEAFVKSVPIMQPGTFIESQIAEESPVTQKDLTLSLIPLQDTIRTRDVVSLQFKIQKDGMPVNASYSVSVTDQSAVPELTGIADINSLSSPFNASSQSLFRIRYDAERGISLRGQIFGATPSTTSNLDIVLTNGKSVSTVVKGSEFTITTDFADSTTAVLKARTNGRSLRVALNNLNPPQMLALPAPLSYELAEGRLLERRTGNSDEARVLADVTIFDKRITMAERANPTVTESRFGPFQRLATKEQIDLIRLNSHRALLNYLAANLPASSASLRVVEGGQQPSEGIIPATYGGGSGPLLYELYWDGMRVPLSELYSLPVQLVNRVELFYRVTTNAIALYSGPVKEDLDIFTVRGFDRPMKFSVPSSGIEPDYRATVYWDANGRTESDGTSKFTFRTTDVYGTYKVVVEGMTDAGVPFRVIRYLEISK
jgi:hypothetical protein